MSAKSTKWNTEDTHPHVLQPWRQDISLSNHTNLPPKLSCVRSAAINAIAFGNDSNPQRPFSGHTINCIRWQIIPPIQINWYHFPWFSFKTLDSHTILDRALTLQETFRHLGQLHITSTQPTHKHQLWHSHLVLNAVVVIMDHYFGSLHPCHLLHLSVQQPCHRHT